MPRLAFRLIASSCFLFATSAFAQQQDGHGIQGGTNPVPAPGIARVEHGEHHGPENHAPHPHPVAPVMHAPVAIVPHEEHPAEIHAVAPPHMIVDHSDHHHPVEVNAVISPTRYISTPRNYVRGKHRRYYYSSYYTTRYIYIEPARPYVEVRCTGTPITGTIVSGNPSALVIDQFGRGHLMADGYGRGLLLTDVLGQPVDPINESCAYQALEYAQPDTQVAWANPGEDYAYTVTPGPVTRAPTGQYCREYQASILVGDQLENGYGTACRMPDGSWQKVN